MKFTHDELYKFLATVRGSGKILRRDDLTPDEIAMAEELVTLGLLSKFETKLTSFYTYGVDGHERN